MKLTCRFFGRFSEDLAEIAIPEEFEADMDVRGLRGAIAALAPEVAARLQSCMVAVNADFVNDDHVLTEGDEVAFSSPGEWRLMMDGKPLIRIIKDEIDLTDLVREMTRPECGAILSFLGVVRDHADGKNVEEIDYTCYEEMAAKELEAVTQRSMDEYGIRHAAVIHRIGRLSVGEASLGVVVASPHRKEAFACGQMIIDEMKKTVPIWKKEFGPDGTNWVE